MIKKLRRKFILITMTFITIILIVIFSILCYDNYKNVRGGVQASLAFALNQYDNAPVLEFGSSKHDQKESQPNMNTFTIITDDAYKVIETHSKNFQISKENAQKLVDSLDTSTIDIGITDDFAYLQEKIQDGHKIAFVDITNSKEIIISHIISSLTIGILAFIAFLVMTILLSDWALRPVQKSWQAQKQFLADASHELKTPLTIILANSDLILSHEDPSKDTMLVQSIQSEANRMKKLVEDLLFLARNDANKETILKVRCNLSEIAWKCILPFESIAFENKLTLTSDIEEDVYVDGDENKLNQLLLIFLDNAIKYTPQNNKIDFNLHQLSNHVQITIFNEGSVIPPDEMENIFDRFYRLDKSREYKGGHGLGLSIAKQIADYHHIDIQVTSTKEKGTTFTLKIPLSKTT